MRPNPPESGRVLGLIKMWPESAEPSIGLDPAANLDEPSAHGRRASTGRGGGKVFRSNKGNGLRAEKEMPM